MGVVLPQGVFLSYRREDTGPYARSLQLQLAQRMPDVPVFMDLDSIEPGLDFAEAIEDAVKSCAVLVALIGRQWATLTDEEGERRLDNPDDYLRFEVKTALERGVRVIPVLIDNARPLRQRDLPEDLHKLARLNAHKLSYDRYQDDADRLLDLIQRVLARVMEQAGSTIAPPAPAVPRNATKAGERFSLPRRATVTDIGQTYSTPMTSTKVKESIRDVFPDLADTIIERGHLDYWNQIGWRYETGMTGDALGWIYHPDGKIKVHVLSFSKGGKDLYYLIGESGISLAR